MGERPGFDAGDAGLRRDAGFHIQRALAVLAVQPALAEGGAPGTGPDRERACQIPGVPAFKGRRIAMNTKKVFTFLALVFALGWLFQGLAISHGVSGEGRKWLLVQRFHDK